jgi:hypothetical protein
MDTLVIYYKIRLTLDCDIWESNDGKHRSYKGITEDWFNWLKTTKYINSKATAGFEVKDKKGEYCRPHFHIHFDSTARKETIQKAMKRRYKDLYDEVLAGNDMYCVKQEPYPDNEVKFYGYAMKQGSYLTFGIDDDKVKEYAAASSAVYKTTCQINQKKVEAKDQADTLYDRLAIYLGKNGSSLKNVVQFYLDNNKPINPTTMQGYYWLYQLKSKEITIDEFVRNRFK